MAPDRNCETIEDDSEVYKGGLGARHWQCLMLFLAETIAYTNRMCLSIAVVAIEKEQKGKDELTSDNIGIILSSFFWGYVLMQIPFGHLARLWSAKMILVTGILMSGVGCMFCPFVFDEGGWKCLCACRVAMGLLQACLLPCINTLLSKWVPPNERGRLCTMTYSGGQFGTVITYPISGALIAAVGWRSVFYIFGAVSVIWSLIFFFVGSDSPAVSSKKQICGISNGEREYIESSLGVLQKESTSTKKKNLKTPWKAILTSIPFWALLIVHCGYNWGFWMLVTEMPIFMAGVLGFDIKENGMKSALPYVAFLLLSYPVSWLSDRSAKRGVSRGLLRKVFNTIGFWGPAFALIGISYVSPGDTTLPVVLLVLSVGLTVGTCCGFQINHMDLSPNYAGLLMSFTNSAAAVVALIAPLIVGKVVTDSTNADQWKIVFFTSGGIYILASLVFILFGSCETQPWNKGDFSENINVDKVTKL